VEIMSTKTYKEETMVDAVAMFLDEAIPFFEE